MSDLCCYIWVPLLQGRNWTWVLAQPTMGTLYASPAFWCPGQGVGDGNVLCWLHLGSWRLDFLISLPDLVPALLCILSPFLQGLLPGILISDL